MHLHTVSSSLSLDLFFLLPWRIPIFLGSCRWVYKCTMTAHRGFYRGFILSPFQGFVGRHCVCIVACINALCRIETTLDTGEPIAQLVERGTDNSKTWVQFPVGLVLIYFLLHIPVSTYLFFVVLQFVKFHGLDFKTPGLQRTLVEATKLVVES